MPLMGMVRCAGCNRIISRVKRVRAKGRKGETYRCGVQNMTKEFGCCPQTIEESEIETAILTMLKKMAAIVADREIPEMRSATLTAEAPPSVETQPERFYHGFVLGLAVELAESYIITSNRESGFGRYDVVMEPKNETDNAMILEFKVRDSGEEKSLEETADAALKQIEEQRYQTDLEHRGFSGDRIRKYGFAFEGKTVLIKSF